MTIKPWLPAQQQAKTTTLGVIQRQDEGPRYRFCLPENRDIQRAARSQDKGDAVVAAPF